MYNVTKGNPFPLRVTLSVDDTPFPIVNAQDVEVFVQSLYKKYSCVHRVDEVAENVVYVDTPATLPCAVYGIEIKGTMNGVPWRTFAPAVLEVTYATEKGSTDDVIISADVYDITMSVHFYKQVSPDEKIDEHNADELAHPAIRKMIPDVSQLATKDELREVADSIPEHIVTDEHYVHTNNNYTNGEKEKLAGLENYDDSELRERVASAYVKPGSGIPAADMADDVQTKLNKADSALQEESDPTVPAWAKEASKPSYNAQEVGALPATTRYGFAIDLLMDSTTYVLTLSLKDQEGVVLNSKTVDLPLESVVVSGRYDAQGKKIVLNLQGGSTIDVPVGDLVAGLQTEITSVNMLSADLVDDSQSRHKFVSDEEKQAWNNKSDFSGDYNDLENKPTIPVVPTKVSAFTNDAGYLTQHQDISNLETKVDIVTASGESLNAGVSKYYRFDSAVNTLVITLPTINTNKISSFVFNFTVGNSPNIVFGSANNEPIYYSDGFALEAGNTYEINALFNGVAWIIASVTININS